jgi:hypothetical protein
VSGGSPLGPSHRRLKARAAAGDGKSYALQLSLPSHFLHGALKPNGGLLVIYCAGRRKVGTGRYEGAKAEMADAVPATVPRPARTIITLSSGTLAVSSSRSSNVTVAGSSAAWRRIVWPSWRAPAELARGARRRVAVS